MLDEAGDGSVESVPSPRLVCVPRVHWARGLEAAEGAAEVGVGRELNGQVLPTRASQPRARNQLCAHGVGRAVSRCMGMVHGGACGQPVRLLTTSTRRRAAWMACSRQEATTRDRRIHAIPTCAQRSVSDHERPRAATPRSQCSARPRERSRANATAAATRAERAVHPCTRCPELRSGRGSHGHGHGGACGRVTDMGGACGRPHTSALSPGITI